MSIPDVDIEDAIDAARTSTALRPLEQIIVRIAISLRRGFSTNDLNAVRDEALLAIVGLMPAHTTPSIRRQLRSIVEFKVADRIRDLKRSRELIVRLETLVEPPFRRENVEAEAISNQGCDRIADALDALRQGHPRDFEAIYASINGLSVAHHLTLKTGTAVSEQNARKILQRARNRLSVLLAVHAEKAS